MSFKYTLFPSLELVIKTVFSQVVLFLIPVKMASALESFVNRQVSIITADGRNFVGTLKGFDQTINIILDDTHERVFSTTQGVEQVRNTHPNSCRNDLSQPFLKKGKVARK